MKHENWHTSPQPQDTIPDTDSLNIPAVGSNLPNNQEVNIRNTPAPINENTLQKIDTTSYFYTRLNNQTVKASQHYTSLFTENYYQTIDSTHQSKHPKHLKQTNQKETTETKPWYLPGNNTTNKTTNDWIVGILLLSLILFAWMKNYYTKHIPHLFKSSVFYREATKQFNNSSTYSQNGATGLTIIFLINMTLFIYLCSKLTPFEVLDYQGVMLFSLIITALTTVLLGKRIIVKIISFAFNLPKLANEYLYNNLLYHKILGIILFPVIIALPFISKDYAILIIKTAVIITIIAYSIRLFRFIQMMYKKRIPFIYILLYLLSIELIPPAIAFKIAHSYI